MKRLASLTCVLLGLCASASAQTVFSILPSPGSTAPLSSNLQYDMVVVFDGYTGSASNTTVFNEPLAAQPDAVSFRAALGATQPYATYSQYLNVWGVYRQSAQAGADKPQNGSFVDTAYNASYNNLLNGTAAPRCLLLTDLAINNGAATQPLGGNTAGLTLALADATNLVPGCDGQVLAIVNDPLYGGCSILGSHGATYNGATPGFPTGPQVGVHELGHISTLLGDEYGSNGGGPGGVWPAAFGEPFSANLTTILNPLKWQQWVSAGLVPANPPQGGNGYNSGIRHPTTTCLMNDSISPHCVVCAEAIVLEIYRCAESVVFASPTIGPTVNTVQGNTSVFNVIHRIPNNQGAVTWTVDGQLLSATPNSPAGQSNLLNLDTTNLSVGNHVVQATVIDNSPFVLSDPLQRLVRTRSWNLSVAAPTPDLHPDFFSQFGNPVSAGGTVDVVTVLDNLGTGPASNVLVHYYLMTSPGLPNPASDVCIGVEVVPSVPVGPQGSGPNLITTLNMPFYADPSINWYVGVLVDPLGQIAELDETNNGAVDSLPLPLSGPAGCPTVLEFRAPGACVTNQLLTSSAAGSTIPIEITAPCHAGEWYAVVISVTGSAPGTVVGPGLVLPINFDFATNIGLQLINGPPFLSFLGLLDGNGRASSLFAPNPGLLGPGGYGITFAAATYTLGPPAVVTGVTNPIVLGVNP